MTFNGRLKDHPVVSTIAERKSEEAKRIPPPKKGRKRRKCGYFLILFFVKKKKKRKETLHPSHPVGGREKRVGARHT